MILLILSLLLSLTTGFFLLSITWQCRKGAFCHFFVKFALSIGLGLGISAFFSLLSLIVFRTLQFETIFICLLVLSVFVGRFSQHRKKKSPSICDQLTGSSNNHILINKSFRYAFILAFLLACCVPLFLSLTHPNGDWDAWAIWNEHARMIFQSESNWTRVFSPNLTHPDYPLLLPLTIARLWAYSGNDSQLAPILITLLFTIGTIVLLSSSIALMKSRLQGYLVGFCLMSTPNFLYAGASQYADIPVSFFFLSALVFLTLALRLKKHPVLLFYTGIALGCALFTKNEGYLLLFAVILSLIIVFRFRWFFQTGRYFLLGLLPLLALILIVKLKYPLPNNFITDQPPRVIFQRLTDLSRYETVSTFFITHSLSFGSFLLNLPGLLLFYTLLVGIRVEEALKIPIIIAFFTIILMVLGYSFVYLITPYDLHWHLANSIDRLLLQLWPSTLYLLFLVLPTPEDILSDRNQTSKNQSYRW